MEDKNINCCSLTACQVKEMLHENTPITPEFYKETIFKQNSPELYTEDIVFIFDEIQKSISKGELHCVINLDSYRRIKITDTSKIWINTHTIPFLEYLGYNVFNSFRMMRDGSPLSNKEGYLSISPFKN